MKEQKEEKEFCTIKEAAKRSGLALQTWYQGGAGTDIVPRIRFGRSIRLLRSDVEQFINDHIRKAKHVIQQEG
jgi:predicted DNA-binding transcriptional regulator AlpA